MLNNIKYYFEKKYITTNIIYGFFTRGGGFSNKPYCSLNCSLNSDDDKKNVNQNIYIAAKKLGLENSHLKLINQVHGTNIEIIDNKNIFKKITADGIITKQKNISLAILTADCAPIFFFDTNNKFICAIHVGWKGCLNDIISKTISKLKEINKSSKIVAVIGPCLSKKNFKIGENLKKKFIEKNSKYNHFFNFNKNLSETYFDMRGLIDFQIKSFSVYKICHINNDTYSEEKLFFSHRRANTQNLPTGRMINIIGFKEKNN